MASDMPFKDPEKQRRYQSEWATRRYHRNRNAYFAGKSCTDCGGSQSLELDHVVEADKDSHRIWSWSRERRDAELAKCVVRCQDCHDKRHGGAGRRFDG